MPTLNGQTLFITGASRGIGLAIALRAARDGANVAIAAKSYVPNPQLPRTLHTAAQPADQPRRLGLDPKCDIREEDQVRAAGESPPADCGGLDIPDTNASANWPRGAPHPPRHRHPP